MSSQGGARRSAIGRANHGNGGVHQLRPAVLGLSRLLFLCLSSAAAASPIGFSTTGALFDAAASKGGGVKHPHGDEDEDLGAPLWVLYVASMVLVLLGGAFAGLTIALMGQDSIYLMVVSKDRDEPQRKNAKRVHDLLNKGKHWVLVTLLLSNVIVNETLPVVLDRCLGGGVAAVVGSTVLIVIFGEILPQSVCVRYGLQIGGFMAKPVLILMYMLAPIAYPTAKLLDWLLGEDHGTVYKKSGLKTLVTLHKSLGEVSERLNQDEVTIISAVLDLKEKAVEDVMTPMEDVFTMSEDAVLDEDTMEMILTAGYSRIPVHEPANPTNFVGMLLVKILITYDPEDCKRVSQFPLATLPETRPETSCLDIVNFFQEGKSHMVLVSEFPGEDHGALGVVTLEDVIEELIGEEIIDESDVYIDVHKAIRRLAPAPKARLQRTNTYGTQPDEGKGKAPDAGGAPGPGAGEGDLIDLAGDDELPQAPLHKRVGSFVTRVESHPPLGSSPKTATFMMRRSSAGVDSRMATSGQAGVLGADGGGATGAVGGTPAAGMIPIGAPAGPGLPPVPVRAGIDEMREHLRHLGPSNPATNPKNTRLTTVKIKPGAGANAATVAVPINITSPVVAPGAFTTLKPPPPQQQQQQQQQPAAAAVPLPQYAVDDEHQPLLRALTSPEPCGGDAAVSTTSLPPPTPTAAPAGGAAAEDAALPRPRLTGKDGVNAVRRSYGSMSGASEAQAKLSATGPHTGHGSISGASGSWSGSATDLARGTIAEEPPPEHSLPKLKGLDPDPSPSIRVDAADDTPLLKELPSQAESQQEQLDHATQTQTPSGSAGAATGALTLHHGRASSSTDSVPSLRSAATGGGGGGQGTGWGTPRRRNLVRSGSITENVVEAGGIRKVVLETNSNSSDENGDHQQHQPGRHGSSTDLLHGRRRKDGGGSRRGTAADIDEGDEVDPDGSGTTGSWHKVGRRHRGGVDGVHEAEFVGEWPPSEGGEDDDDDDEDEAGEGAGRRESGAAATPGSSLTAAGPSNPAGGGQQQHGGGGGAAKKKSRRKKRKGSGHGHGHGH